MLSKSSTKVANEVGSISIGFALLGLPECEGGVARAKHGYLTILACGIMHGVENMSSTQVFCRPRGLK